MPKFPDWLNIWFGAVLITSMSLAFVRFGQLQTNTLSDLMTFLPTGFIAALWIVLPAMFHLFSIVPQYDLATWLAVVCILISFIFIYEAVQASDAGRQSVLSSFGGAIFGFGTGMPIGRRLQPVKVSIGDKNG